MLGSWGGAPSAALVPGAVSQRTAVSVETSGVSVSTLINSPNASPLGPNTESASSRWFGITQPQIGLVLSAELLGIWSSEASSNVKLTCDGCETRGGNCTYVTLAGAAVITLSARMRFGIGELGPRFGSLPRRIWPKASTTQRSITWKWPERMGKNGSG